MIACKSRRVQATSSPGWNAIRGSSLSDGEDEPEAPPWRSDQIAFAAAVSAVLCPVAFVLLGWIVGALFAALAAALAAVMFLAARFEQAELSRRVETAEAEAEAARQSNARLLSTLSHDLRQPIHALSLYAAALDKRIQAEDARAILAKLDLSVQAAADLISRVEAYAQFAAQTVKPAWEDCALQDVLAEVIAAHPNIAAPSSALRVRTDPRLLRALLDRLAENATRFAGAGRIELSTRGAEVEIAVVDEGPGIDAADHARMFEQFVRLDNARGAGGLGIGLPIAQRLADALGARVEVKSAPGAGARFSVCIPIASAT